MIYLCLFDGDELQSRAERERGFIAEGDEYERGKLGVTPSCDGLGR